MTRFYESPALDWEELICGKVDLQKSRAEDSPAIMYTRTCAPFQQKKNSLCRGELYSCHSPPPSFIAVISSLEIFSTVVFTPHFFNSISLSLITNWKKIRISILLLGQTTKLIYKLYTVCTRICHADTLFLYRLAYCENIWIEDKNTVLPVVVLLIHLKWRVNKNAVFSNSWSCSVKSWW